MKVLIQHKTFETRKKEFMHCPNTKPIPRMGEYVNMGYEPLSKVTSIAYDYEQGMVLVIVE